MCIFNVRGMVLYIFGKFASIFLRVFALMFISFY